MANNTSDNLSSENYNNKIITTNKKIIFISSLLGILGLIGGTYISFMSGKIILGVIIILSSYIFITSITNSLKKRNQKKSTEIKTDNKNINDLIKKLADSSQKISRGESQGVLDIDRNDDIGRIADAFNTLINNFSNLLHTLDGMAEKSFSTSRELSEATQNTSRAMGEVSATIQELTSTTQDMNNNMEEISDGAEEIEDLAQNGLSQMNNMEQEMSNIMKSAEKAGSRIQNLNDSMTEIEEIVGVISNIAKQTNLLALNAAIEAARAGEKGKGFAVVAEEIRELSQDTQDSLEKISDLVTNLTSETSRTVDIIQSNNEQIATGEKVLKNTSRQFTNITDNIQNIVSSINQTTEASRQLSHGSQEITSSTENQAEAIDKINNLAENLEDMAAQFKEILANTKIGKVDIEVDLDKFDREMQQITSEQTQKLKNELNITDQFVIGVIARLEPIKGHEFFFKGLKSLTKNYNNVKCLIIGDGSLENDLKEIVKKEGMNGIVEFLGYREDIQELMTVIDLIVLTSQKEGMPPRIIMEAMAAEKPVVVTDTTGNQALVEDEVTGMIVEYGNTIKLKESMEYFLNHKNKLYEFGDKGRQRIEELDRQN
ncbi:MAG: methyl-accepting chemotaxis protein [Bacillota bacterium]